MQGWIAVVAAITVQCPFLRRWQGVLIGRLCLYRLAQDFIDAFHRLECARTGQALTLVIRLFCPLRDIATGASIGRMGAQRAAHHDLAPFSCSRRRFSASSLAPRIWRIGHLCRSRNTPVSSGIVRPISLSTGWSIFCVAMVARMRP